MLGRPNVLNHLSIPAACFTHPEVSFVGVTQEKAEEMAKEQGFKLGLAKTSFKANSKVCVCVRAHVCMSVLVFGGRVYGDCLPVHLSHVALIHMEWQHPSAPRALSTRPQPASHPTAFTRPPPPPNSPTGAG
jgi:hypothetical protein